MGVCCHFGRHHFYMAIVISPMAIVIFMWPLSSHPSALPARRHLAHPPCPPVIVLPVRLACLSSSWPSSLPGRRHLAHRPCLPIIALPVVLAWPLAVVIFGRHDLFFVRRDFGHRDFFFVHHDLCPSVVSYILHCICS